METTVDDKVLHAADAMSDAITAWMWATSPAEQAVAVLAAKEARDEYEQD